jgi:hypothetical protein
LISKRRYAKKIERSLFGDLKPIAGVKNKKGESDSNGFPFLYNLNFTPDFMQGAGIYSPSP